MKQRPSSLEMKKYYFRARTLASKLRLLVVQFFCRKLMWVGESGGVSSRFLFFILYVFIRISEISILRERDLSCIILNFTKPPKFRYMYNVSNKKQHDSRLYNLIFKEEIFNIEV